MSAAPHRRDAPACVCSLYWLTPVSPCPFLSLSALDWTQRPTRDSPVMSRGEFPPWTLGLFQPKLFHASMFPWFYGCMTWVPWFCHMIQVCWMQSTHHPDYWQSVWIAMVPMSVAFSWAFCHWYSTLGTIQYIFRPTHCPVIRSALQQFACNIGYYGRQHWKPCWSRDNQYPLFSAHSSQSSHQRRP